MDDGYVSLGSVRDQIVASHVAQGFEQKRAERIFDEAFKLAEDANIAAFASLVLPGPGEDDTHIRFLAVQLFADCARTTAKHVIDETAKDLGIITDKVEVR